MNKLLEIKAILKNNTIRVLFIYIALVYNSVTLNEITNKNFILGFLSSIFPFTILLISFLFFAESIYTALLNKDYNRIYLNKPISIYIQLFIVFISFLFTFTYNYSPYNYINLILIIFCNIYMAIYLFQCIKYNFTESNNIYIGKIKNITGYNLYFIIPILYQKSKKHMNSPTHSHWIICFNTNIRNWTTIGFLNYFNSNGLYFNKQLITYNQIEIFNREFNKIFKNYTKEEFQILQMYAL